MSSLLNVLENEAVDNQRQVEAAARLTCDYCGRAFRYGYSWQGNSGGYSHLRTTIRYEGRYYVVCGERCREGIWGYLRRRLGRVPRLVGRRTIEEVLR